MGRPLKTKVSETSAETVQAVITRVAKKLKTFTSEALKEGVTKSFKDVTDSDIAVLSKAVSDWSVGSEQHLYTWDHGTYKAIVGKRGRPKKAVATFVAAV